jgi:hypothetical protein
MRRVLLGVLGVALFFVTPVAPGAIQRGGGGEGEAVVMEGRVLVLIACDLEAGTAEMSYQIETDDGSRFPLELLPAMERPLRSGIRLRG